MSFWPQMEHAWLGHRGQRVNPYTTADRLHLSHLRVTGHCQVKPVVWRKMVRRGQILPEFRDESGQRMAPISKFEKYRARIRCANLPHLVTANHLRWSWPPLKFLCPDNPWSRSAVVKGLTLSLSLRKILLYIICGKVKTNNQLKERRPFWVFFLSI